MWCYVRVVFCQEACSRRLVPRSGGVLRDGQRLPWLPFVHQEGHGVPFPLRVLSLLARFIKLHLTCLLVRLFRLVAPRGDLAVLLSEWQARRTCVSSRVVPPCAVDSTDAVHTGLAVLSAFLQDIRHTLLRRVRINLPIVSILYSLFPLIFLNLLLFRLAASGPVARCASGAFFARRSGGLGRLVLRDRRLLGRAHWSH